MLSLGRITSIVVALTVATWAPPVVAAPAPQPARQTPEPPPPRREHPPGHAMVVVGVTLVVGSVVGYVIMAAGLGIGNRAEQDVRSLGGPEDIERRREVLQRGRLGNRMAIGAGVTSAALMAAGLPLVIVGRRRASRALQRSGVSLGPLRGGMGLSWRLRF